MPRIVTSPLPYPPHACLATGRDDGPIIDFERDTIAAPIGADPHVYMKASVIQDTAVELLGMVPKADVDALRETVEQLTEMLEEKTALLAAYDTIKELTPA